MNSDTTKNQKAAELIAAQLLKIKANKITHTMTGANKNNETDRQAQAQSMALYFVGKMYGIKWSGNLVEDMTGDERQAIELVKEIAVAAIAISGK